jgi:hypothetical protein
MVAAPGVDAPPWAAPRAAGARLARAAGYPRTTNTGIRAIARLTGYDSETPSPN